MLPEVWVLGLERALVDRQVTDGRMTDTLIARIRKLAEENPDAHLLFTSTRPLGEVYGTLLQALGHAFLASGKVAIAYDRGAGVFIPGPVTRKIQRFAALDARLLAVFEEARRGLFECCDMELGWSCLTYHLAGYEFSLGVRPNAPEDTEEAREVTEKAIPFLIRLVAQSALNQLPGPNATTTPADEAAKLQRRATQELLFDGLVESLLNESPELAGVLEKPEEVYLHPPEWLQIDLSFTPGRETTLRAKQLDLVGAFTDACDHWGLKRPKAHVVGAARHDLALIQALQSSGEVHAACPENAEPEVRAWIETHGGTVYPRGFPEKALDLGPMSTP